MFKIQFTFCLLYTDNYRSTVNKRYKHLSPWALQAEEVEEESAE